MSLNVGTIWKMLFKCAKISENLRKSLELERSFKERYPPPEDIFNVLSESSKIGLDMTDIEDSSSLVSDSGYSSASTVVWLGDRGAMR